MKFGNTLAGAGIGLATGGLGGAIIGAGLGYSQDANNAAAQKAADRANEMNLAYWNMQNDYNSPVAQMARLKEAGLNPMLVYGSGNVTGNSSTAIGTPQTYANKMNVMAGLQGVQALADLKQTGAQTANTQANTAVAQANELQTYQNIQNLQSANAYTQAQTEYVNEQTNRLINDNEFYERFGYYPAHADTPAGSAYETGLGGDLLEAFVRGKQKYEERIKNNKNNA